MTQRKTFTPAFKLEIAKLMVDENYTIKQACEASGAGETAVKRWRQQYLAELAGKPLPNAQALTPEQREIQQLKQRIRKLETEKEILKKASAFYAPEGIFAKEMR
jgi:transposase